MGVLKFDFKKDTEKVLEAIKDDLGLEMVLCPKGQFKMSSKDKSSLSWLIMEGYTDQDSWYPTESFESGISGQVKIEIPFLIGKYPVTQKQYELITGKNPSTFKGENNPVDSVSKKEACEFCNILNKKYKNLLGEIYEFCLPLETQWEYACCAGVDACKEKRSLDEIAWHKNNSLGKTHPVGLKKPNKCGIYDMHGNVAEYCFETHISEGAQKWDSGCFGRDYDITKGGSWFSEACHLTSGSDLPFCPGVIRVRDEEVGFRIILIQTAYTVQEDNLDDEIANIEYENDFLKILKSLLNMDFIYCPSGKFKMDARKTCLGIECKKIDELNEDLQEINIEKPFWVSKNTVVDELECKQGRRINVPVYSVSDSFGTYYFNTNSFDKAQYGYKQHSNLFLKHNVYGCFPDFPQNKKGTFNYEEAIEYCDKLTEKFSKFLPNGYKFNLLTTEQWEYASKNAKDILGIGKFSEYVLGRHRYHYHTNLTVKRGGKGGIKTCPATNDSESLILGYEHINPTPGVLRLGIVPEG